MKAFRITTILTPVLVAGFSIVGASLPTALALGQGSGAAGVPSQLATATSAGDQATVGGALPTLVGRKRLRDVVGFVVDEEDVPIPGATVVLRERSSWFHSEPPEWPAPKEDLASCATDAEGYFEFRGIYDFDEDKKLDVIAWAEGYGASWWHIPVDDMRPRNTLQLRNEYRFRGVIVDHQGNPAGNATVQLSHVMPIEQLATLDLDNRQWPDEDLGEYLMAEGSGHMPMVKADDHGAFVMTSLPRDSGVVLRVTHAKHAIARMYVATSDVTSINRDVAKRSLQTQDGQLTLKRPRRVTLRVVCGESGLPAVGARVRQFPDRRGKMPPIEVTGDCTVVYNHVVTEDLYFMILPPIGSDYLEAHEKFKIPVDDFDVEYTVKLFKGRVIPGRVVDSKTGNGVANVTLLGIGQKHTRSPTRFDRAYGPVVTDADGYFRFPVLPETKVIAVKGYVPGYRTPLVPGDTSRTFSAEVSGDSPSNLEFVLDPAPHVMGTVRDPDGRPVPNATVSARVAVCDYAVLVVNEKTDAQGRYSLDLVYSPIYDKGDYESTHVEFTSQDGKLSGSLELPPWHEGMGSDDQVFDVVLTPVP